MGKASSYANGIYLTNLKIKKDSEYIPFFCFNQLMARAYKEHEDFEYPIAILPEEIYSGENYPPDTFSRMFSSRSNANKLPLRVCKYRKREYLVGYQYIQDKLTGSIILGKFIKRDDLLQIVNTEAKSSTYRYPPSINVATTQSKGHMGLLKSYEHRMCSINYIVNMNLNASDIFYNVPIDIHAAQELISSQKISPRPLDVLKIPNLSSSYTMYNYFTGDPTKKITLDIFNLSDYVGGMHEIASSYMRGISGNSLF